MSRGTIFFMRYDSIPHKKSPPIKDDGGVPNGTNLDINHDLYASAIRKNQDHPIFMALEVSVCEPQNYV